MSAAMFDEAGTTLIAELLGTASDIGSPREALDWLEAKLIGAIEAASKDLQRSMANLPRWAPPARLPLMAGPVVQDEARLLHKVAIAFGRVRLRSVKSSETQVTATTRVEMRDFFISHAARQHCSWTWPCRPNCTGSKKT